MAERNFPSRVWLGSVKSGLGRIWNCGIIINYYFVVIGSGRKIFSDWTCHIESDDETTCNKNNL